MKKQKQKKGKKKKSPEEIRREKLKLEVAKELGLSEKLAKVGWGGLSAKETGKIGGYITRILRRQKEISSNLPPG